MTAATRPATTCPSCSESPSKSWPGSWEADDVRAFLNAPGSYLYHLLDDTEDLSEPSRSKRITRARQPPQSTDSPTHNRHYAPLGAVAFTKGGARAFGEPILGRTRATSRYRAASKSPRSAPDVGHFDGDHEAGVGGADL